MAASLALLGFYLLCLVGRWAHWALFTSRDRN
jgi:hypothetical protein